VDEGAHRQLDAELATNREALLAIVEQVDDEALLLPTRNEGWSVRDVIAHVLASDADLVALVEAAGVRNVAQVEGRSRAEHEREMARWADATAGALVEALRKQGDLWCRLLDALPEGAWALPTQAWWTPAATVLGETIEDYRTHDVEHGEDVRLALDIRDGG
jgi:uncharacterized protein (TIGR03083 family)